MGALAFAGEVAMLVILGVSAFGFGSQTWLHVLLAAALVAVAAVIWGRWMAPKSAVRLVDPGRFLAQVALFAVTAVIASLAGRWQLGVVFFVVVTAVFAVARFTHAGVAGSPSGS